MTYTDINNGSKNLVKPTKHTAKLNNVTSMWLVMIRSGIIGVDNPTVNNSELYADEHKIYK